MCPQDPQALEPDATRELRALVREGVREHTRGYDPWLHALEFYGNLIEGRVLQTNGQNGTTHGR